MIRDSRNRRSQLHRQPLDYSDLSPPHPATVRQQLNVGDLARSAAAGKITEIGGYDV